VALLLSLGFVRSGFLLRRRARYDYRTARGTQHLRQLSAAIPALKKSMHARETRIDALERQLEQLRFAQTQALVRALSEQLVSQRLTEVRGIGATLSQRVIQHSFRGSLRDLHTAYRVEGIGPALQSAISAWVQDRQAELPKLLAGDFTGKQHIEARYADSRASLQRQLDSEGIALERETQLYDTAQTTIEQFRQVRPAHFRRALRRKDRKSPVPAWYLEGVYRAWEPMPGWFAELLNNYGG
jgi:hypothetical protein